MQVFENSHFWYMDKATPRSRNVSISEPNCRWKVRYESRFVDQLVHFRTNLSSLLRITLWFDLWWKQKGFIKICNDVNSPIDKLFLERLWFFFKLLFLNFWTKIQVWIEMSQFVFLALSMNWDFDLLHKIVRCSK